MMINRNLLLLCIAAIVGLGHGSPIDLSSQAAVQAGILEQDLESGIDVRVQPLRRGLFSKQKMPPGSEWLILLGFGFSRPQNNQEAERSRIFTSVDKLSLPNHPKPVPPTEDLSLLPLIVWPERPPPNIHPETIDWPCVAYAVRSDWAKVKPQLTYTEPPTYKSATKNRPRGNNARPINFSLEDHNELVMTIPKELLKPLDVRIYCHNPAGAEDKQWFLKEDGEWKLKDGAAWAQWGVKDLPTAKLTIQVSADVERNKDIRPWKPSPGQGVATDHGHTEQLPAYPGEHPGASSSNPGR